MQKKHETCLVRGCGKATNGKQHCTLHISPEQRRKLPSAMTKMIRSACCESTCISGEGHEHGEQYCTKCKQACCWKSAA